MYFILLLFFHLIPLNYIYGEEGKRRKEYFSFGYSVDDDVMIIGVVDKDCDVVEVITCYNRGLKFVLFLS